MGGFIRLAAPDCKAGARAAALAACTFERQARRSIGRRRLKEKDDHIIKEYPRAPIKEYPRAPFSFNAALVMPRRKATIIRLFDYMIAGHVRRPAGDRKSRSSAKARK
jgi:hypothetical protein